MWNKPVNSYRGGTRALGFQGRRFSGVNVSPHFPVFVISQSQPLASR